MAGRARPEHRTLSPGEVAAAVTTARIASARSDRRQHCPATSGTAGTPAARRLHSHRPRRRPRALDCRPCPAMTGRPAATGTPTTEAGLIDTNSLPTQPTPAIPALDLPGAPTRLSVWLTPLHRPWSASGCSSMSGGENRSASAIVREWTRIVMTDTRDGSGWLLRAGYSVEQQAAVFWQRADGQARPQA